MEEHVDTRTTIIVNKLPGLPSSLIYVFLVVGQDAERTEFFIL